VALHHTAAKLLTALIGASSQVRVRDGCGSYCAGTSPWPSRSSSKEPIKMVSSSKSTVAKFTARAKNAKKTDDKLDNIANAIEDLAAFVDDLEQQLSGIRNQLKRIEDKIR
jgi:outer membrane murein-binding lipoprotein Lpp